MIRFACPNCQEKVPFADEDAGQVVVCSGCQKKLRLPALKKGDSQLLPAKPREESFDDLEEVPQPSSPQKTKPANEDPRASRPQEEPDDDLEEVPQPSSPRKTKPADDGDLRDSSPQEEPDEDEEDRPKNKKKKPSDVLGSRRETFTPNKSMLTTFLIISAITGFGGLMCIALTLAHVMMDGGVALALFMIPGGILGSLWCYWFLSLKVVLHQGGLAHSHFGKRRLISWEGIESVKQAIIEHYMNGAHTKTTYHYTLTLDDVTRLVCTKYLLQHVEKLGKRNMDQTTKVILPRARRAYNKGKMVDFGPLSVSQDGLHYGNSLLVWEDIQGVKLKEGYISVSKRGKWLRWCNISASSVPNLLTFLTMVNEIVGLDDDE